MEWERLSLPGNPRMFVDFPNAGADKVNYDLWGYQRSPEVELVTFIICIAAKIFWGNYVHGGKKITG